MLFQAGLLPWVWIPIVTLNTPCSECLEKSVKDCHDILSFGVVFLSKTLQEIKALLGAISATNSKSAVAVPMR